MRALPLPCMTRVCGGPGVCCWQTQGKKVLVPLPMLAADGLPIKLGFTQKAGRHILAAHPVAAGQQVAAEAPALRLLSAQACPDFCAVCLSRLAGGAATDDAPSCYV